MEVPAVRQRLPDRGDRVLDVASKYSLIMVALLLFVFFVIVENERFATVRNLQTMFASSVVVALLALGVIFPLIVGEFDLSVGYTLGLSQALAIGLLGRNGWGIWLAILVVLALSTLIGTCVGFVVASTGIHSLIVTLAAGSIIAGATQWYTGGSVMFEGVPEPYTRIARSNVAGIPLPIVYLVVAVLIILFVLDRTPFGRRMYAVGGNRDAAVLVGIKVRPLVIASFAISGLCAGAAGVLISSRLASAQPGLGPDFLLPAFAAAFLGATAIRPGRFNPIGVVVAVYLLAVATTGLGLMGVPGWAELVFNGAALLVAVWISFRVAAVKRLRTERRYREAALEG